jgi:hypothetical protein
MMGMEQYRHPGQALAGRVLRRLACLIVDGNRGYSGEQDNRWFPGESGYGQRYDEGQRYEEGSRYDDGVPRYDDDRYRVPERRHAGADQSAADPLDTRTSIGPRSGVELPPYSSDAPFVPEPAFPAEPPPTIPPSFPPDPADPLGEHHTQSIDRAALRRPGGPAPAGKPGPTVYRSRRVGAAGILGAAAVVVELLLVRVLLTGEFASTVVPGAVLGGLFAMTGVPLVAMGLYGLMTGAATAAGATPARAWLRTPLAYLPVGLALLVAAGLATG